jgi:phospholipase C
MSGLTTRRRFVAGAAAAVGAAALGRPVLGARAADPGFDHVVVVMMENRSFDHMLGWLPGADGRQAGLTYTDAARHTRLGARLPGLRPSRPRPLL